MKKFLIVLLVNVAATGVFAEGMEYHLAVSIPGKVYIFTNYYGEISDHASFTPLFKEQSGIIFKEWVEKNRDKYALPVSSFKRVDVNNGSVTYLALDTNGHVLCRATTLWQRVSGPEQCLDYSLRPCVPYDKGVTPDGHLVFRHTLPNVEPLPAW